MPPIRYRAAAEATAERVGDPRTTRLSPFILSFSLSRRLLSLIFKFSGTQDDGILHADRWGRAVDRGQPLDDARFLTVC